MKTNILIFSFVLLGGLNKKYNFFFEPVDWVIIILFLMFVLNGLAGHRNYIFDFTWIDKLLLIYFTFVVFTPLIIPLTTNTLNTATLFGHFIPLRLWLVYRVFYCVTAEISIRGKFKKFNINYFVRILIYAGLVSAFISLVRMLQLPFALDFIDKTWPITTFGRTIGRIGIDSYRLWGTNGGTNAAGNLFAILSLISFDQYIRFRWKNSLYYSLTFVLCVILSGSFSSIGALIIISIFYFRKKIRIKYVCIGLSVVLLAYTLIISTDKFHLFVGRRFLINFTDNAGNFTPIPNNLVSRIGYWDSYLKLLITEEKLLFGWGPGGARNYTGFTHGNPESFYFFLLNSTGISGLATFFIFISIILYKVNILVKQHKIPKVIFYVVLFYPIAGIANQTLHYGALTEIFAMILSFLCLSRKNITGPLLQNYLQGK